MSVKSYLLALSACLCLAGQAAAGVPALASETVSAEQEQTASEQAASAEQEQAASEQAVSAEDGQAASAGTVAAMAGEQKSTPHEREDGGKYRIGLVDYDEYLPSNRQFYYILNGLVENGWITGDGLPFSREEIERGDFTIKEMYEALSSADLGPFIEFPEGAFHYLAYEDEEAVKADLTERAEGGLDLVITSGTSAGVFVKELELPIPMTDYSATDPVASGIIDSATEGSGHPNVWAQVEPSLPFRQLRYYYSVRPFQKLGIIVYGDETISGVPDIEASAKEIGFSLVKYNIAETKRENEADKEAYYSLVESELRRMAGEGIDAFFLTVDLINDTDRLSALLAPLYEQGIPVYLMDDVSYVQAGALMLISANDMENVGRFIADTIGEIFSGAEAGSLPCVYTSAPSIYVNYDTAVRLKYPLTFEFLSVCDEIYTEKKAA